MCVKTSYVSLFFIFLISSISAALKGSERDRIKDRSSEKSELNGTHT